MAKSLPHSGKGEPTRSRARPSPDDWYSRLEETLLSASTIVWELDVVTGAVRQTGGFAVAPSLRIEKAADFLALVHPDDRAWVTAGFEKRLELGEPWSVEYRIVFSDGQVRWVQDRAMIHHKPDGTTSVRSAMVDITDRKLAELALAKSEERLQATQAASEIGTAEWQVGEQSMTVSPTFRELYGLSPQAVITFEGWLALIHPNDLERVTRSLQGSFDIEFRIMRPSDRATRWINAKGELKTGARRAPLRLLTVHFDITDRKSTAEREHLLTREVDHRAKNLLAVVQSVIRLTHADTIDAFTEAVTGRVDAMARAHSLLAASRWDGADLTVLVEEELAAFNRDEARAVAAGPNIKLKPAAAQSVALVIHELATNAAKYGALSVDKGSVKVGWCGGPPATSLSITWLESGGPPVAEPSRQGFGSTLIRASVERQLRGAVSFKWLPEGLQCQLTLPSDVVAQAAEAPAAMPQPEKRPSRSVANRCILVVDDEALITMEVERHLAAAGARVLGPACTVDEALALIEKQKPDAVLLDIKLSDGPSFPLADILKSRGISFGFATGFDSAPIIPERLRSVPVLSKPFAPADLLEFLQGLLSKS